MCELSNHSRAELEKMTKEDLVKGILDGVTYSNVNLVKDKYGNSIEQSSESYQTYDGNLAGKQMVTWTYYDTKIGNVQNITVDDGIGEKQRTVSAYSLDPMVQPTVSKYIMTEPIPLPEKIIEGMAGGLGGAASGAGNLFVKIKDTITGLFRV